MNQGTGRVARDRRRDVRDDPRVASKVWALAATRLASLVARRDPPAAPAETPITPPLASSERSKDIT